MALRNLKSVSGSMNQVPSGAPLLDIVNTGIATAQENDAVLHEQSPFMGDSPEATDGYFQLGRALDDVHTESLTKKIELETAQRLTDQAKQRLEAADPRALEMHGPFPDQASAEYGALEFRQKKIVDEASRRGEELGIFKSDPIDSETKDAKEARIKAGQTTTDEEKNLLLEREKAYHAVENMPKTVRVGSDGRPLIIDLTTSKGVNYGTGEIFQTNGKTYMAVKNNRDENGQELQDITSANSQFVELDTNWDKFHQGKLDKKAALMNEIEALGKQQKEQTDFQAQAFMNQGDGSAGRGMMVNNQEQIEAKQREVAEIEKEIEVLEGPTGRDELIKMQANAVLTTDQRFKDRLPRGEHFGFKKAWDDSDSWNPFYLLTGSKHFMNAAGGLTSTMLSEYASARYLLGGSPEEMKKLTEQMKNMEVGRAAMGYGILAHQDDFISTALQELPVEAMETMTDVAFGFFAGGPATVGVRMAARKARKEALRLAGNASVDMATRVGVRAEAAAVARVQAKLGPAITTGLSAIPGALEEASVVIERLEKPSQMREDAKALTAQLETTSVEGGMALAPEERAAIQQRRDQLLTDAAIEEENVADAFYAVGAASWGAQFVNLDKIVKTDHSGANIADLMMRKMARKKLGKGATEEAIVNEGREMMKSLTEGKIQEFIKNTGGGKLSDLAGDALVGGATEYLEAVMSTGIQNHFFEEFEETFGSKDAMTEGGIGMIIGFATSFVTGRLSVGQKRRAMNDLLRSGQRVERLKGKATDDMLKTLRDNGITQFGQMQLPDEVVHQEQDGTFSIKDDADIGTIDNPMGYFAGVKFKTREEAKAFAENRWETAYDMVMDKAVASSINITDDQGNIIPNPDAAAVQAEMIGAKAMVRTVANAAAESGKTTTNHFYSALLRSKQVGGNVMIGNVDRSRLSRNEADDQDAATAILALATSSAVSSPELKATLVAATEDAASYLSKLKSAQEARTKNVEHEDGVTKKQLESIDLIHKADVKALANGQWVKGGAHKKTAAELGKKSKDKAQQILKAVTTGDDKTKKGIKAHLEKLTGQPADTLFDATGAPVLDFEDKVSAALRENGARAILERKRLDAYEAVKEDDKKRKREAVAPTAVERLNAIAYIGNAEVEAMISTTVEKMRKNRALLKGNPPKKQASGNSTKATTPAANTAPAFTPNPAMDQAIEEAFNKGQDLTKEQETYVAAREAANEAAGKPTSLNQEATTLFQSDEPVEDKTAPDKNAEFDYTLARTEEDDAGTERRVYNYGALERLVTDAMTTGKINGFPTPPNLRNPASLAMVFLRTQAYTEKQIKDGKEVTQRENFGYALDDIYAPEGVAKKGRFQIYNDEKLSLHKQVMVSNTNIFNDLKKNSNDPEGGNVVYLDEGADKNLLPLGFFGPVAFTYRVQDDKKRWGTRTVYALVSDVFGYDDKKSYFDKGVWKGKPIETALASAPDNGSIIKRSNLGAEAQSKYPDKGTMAYKHPVTGEWVVPGKDGTPPFARKRAYKMIPVTKAYAEARAVFDARARRRAFVDSYLNNPIPRSVLSLKDRRTAAKLRTREVLGMQISELNGLEKNNEIQRLQAEMDNAERILDGDLGEGSLKTLEETIAGFEAEMMKLEEASRATVDQMSNARTTLQSTHVEMQRVARETAETQKTPDPKGFDQPRNPALDAENKAKMDVAKAAMDAAKAKLDEAQAAFAMAEGERQMARAGKPEVMDAIAKLNYFKIRQARIKALESDKGLTPKDADRVLETLATSGTMPKTVRMYATAILKDLKEAGVQLPSLKTKTVTVTSSAAKGAKGMKREVAVETLGEYLNRTAQIAVNAMASKWMRSRTEDILKMKVEKAGPETNPNDPPPFTPEELMFHSAALEIFPDFDPNVHSRNLAIDTLLLQPDIHSNITIPYGYIAKGQTVQDLLAAGNVGFAAPVYIGGTSQLDTKKMAANAIAEGNKRGKPLTAKGLRLIRMPDGTWLRRKDDMGWMQVDKAFLYRHSSQKIMGMTMAGTRAARAYGASLLNGVRMTKDFATDPTVLTSTFDEFANRTEQVVGPLSSAIAGLVDSVGPSGADSVKALHRSLGRFQRVRATLYRSERGLVKGLAGPTQRSGTPIVGMENLPFEEQLDGMQKMNDDIDGALGSAEQELAKFMQGGRFLQATEAPQQTFERGVPIKEVKGTRDTWLGPEMIYGKVVGEVMTTFPDAAADEMIDMMLETIGINSAVEQDDNFQDAGIDDDEKRELEDDLDTINEADENEIEEGVEDPGTLLEFDDSGDEVEDPSIFGENSGMGIGNTDSQDYQRLVEMLKSRSYIPDGVQNLGEFTIEQWMQGEDYDVAKPEASVFEDWSKEKEMVSGGGFVMQHSSWNRRRLVMEKAFDPVLGIANPESPIRKELTVGDLVTIVKPTKPNMAMPMQEIIQDGELVRILEGSTYDFFGGSKLETETFEVVEIGDKFKLGKPKDLEKMVRYEAAKFKPTTKPKEQLDEYKENPYPKPSIFEIETMVNRMLGQSVQAATRLIEANSIRRKLKDQMLKLKQETDPKKIKQILAKAGDGLMALQGTEPMEKIQGLAKKLKQLEDTAPPDTSKARERLQKKLVGTFWYRGRVKGPAKDFSSVIWHYLDKDGKKERPDLDTLRKEIFENLGIPEGYGAKELMEELVSSYDNASDEKKQALKQAQAYVGALVAWLDQGQEREAEMARRYDGGPYSEMVKEFRHEIDLAGDFLAETSGREGWQREVDYKFIADNLHNYHYELSMSEQRAMAGILTDILLRATAITDSATDTEKGTRSARGRVSAIWQSGKYALATKDLQFNSVGDRIKAAMMPAGWTVPYTSEGIDVSDAKDSIGPDYEGIMDRPPTTQPEEGDVNFVETDQYRYPTRSGFEKEQGSGSGKTRPLEVRPWFGVWQANKTITRKKVSKKEQERRKDRRGQMGSTAIEDIHVASELRSLAVTDTIFGVNPSIDQVPAAKLEGEVKNIIETNRAARKAYYSLKGKIRAALGKDTQVVEEMDPETEMLFDLVLRNWSPVNDNRGNKSKGEPPAGQQANPEMTGAPDTLFQGQNHHWRGRVTLGGGVPHAILELNPKSATVETFGHEVVHWLNNVTLSDGTSLLEAAMGPDGYSDLMGWAKMGNPPESHPEGSVARKQAWIQAEERLANGVMAYFAGGKEVLGDADPGIVRFAEIVQRIWRQVRQVWESDAKKSLWGTPEGMKAITALDDLFVHSRGARQLRKMDSMDLSQESVIKQMMKLFPKVTRPDALRMVAMLPDIRKRMLLDLNQPIVPSTGEGLTQDDPFTELYQFDHTTDIAKAPAEPKWITQKYRDSRSGLSDSTLWRWAMKFLSWWTPTGFVTEPILQAKLGARGFRTALQQEAVQITDDLQRAIDESVTFGDTKKKTLAIYKQLNSYLTASSIKDKLKARAELSKLTGPRMLIAAMNARSMIDRLSHELVADGYVFGNVALTITQNLGTYLHRKFPMAKGMDLSERLRNPEMASLLTNIQAEMIAKGFAKDAAEAYGIIVAVLDKIDSTSLAPQKFADMVGQMQGLSSALKSRTIKEEDLAMLLAPLTGMETNPIIRVSDTIRVLTDKMTKTKFEADLRDAGLKAGYIGLPGDMRFSKIFGTPEGGPKGKPALDSMQAAIDNPADANTIGPLQGYRTTPEISEFYQEAVEQEFEFKNSWTLLNTMIKVNGLFKVMATVNNWPTALKNIYGAYLTYMGCGRSIAGLRQAWGDVFDYEFANIGDRRVQKQAKTEKARAMFNEYARLSLIDGSQLGDFMELAANGDKFATTLLGGVIAADSAEGFIGRKFRRGFQKYRRARIRFYLQGDLFFKIAAYHAELNDLRQLYATDTDPKKPVDDELKRMAAMRVSRTMFSFDREPQGIRMLKTFPIMGNFISFQAGMLRARIGGFRMVYEDFRQSAKIKATNPEGSAKLFRMAMRRGMGLVASHAMTTKMAAGFIASMFGWDEEKLEALSLLAPDFQRGGLLIPLGKFEPGGEVTYMNLSTLLPDAWHMRFASSLVGLTTEMVSRAANGTLNEDFDHRFTQEIVNTFAAATGPFTDATATRKLIDMAFNNRDQYDNPIWGAHDSFVDRGINIVFEAGRLFIPGDIRTAARLGLMPQEWNLLVLNNTPKQQSDWKKGMAALGFTQNVMNLSEDLKYRFATEAEAIFSSKSEFQRLLTDDDIVLNPDKANKALTKNIEETDTAVRRLSAVMEASLTLGVAMPTIIEAMAKGNPKNPTQNLGKDLTTSVLKGYFGGQVRLTRQTNNSINDAAVKAKDPQRPNIINQWVLDGLVKIESGR